MINVGEDGYELKLRLYENQVDIMVVCNGERIHNGNLIGLHRDKGYYDLYLWRGLNSTVNIDRDEAGIVKIMNVDII
jgi:hypothetical protein